ncbi:hypothetical protein BGZ95_001892 [Linnemannia exigua]|uniref:SUN domain-containing protein n=1 Tax=Linnemannia exigua TaxID=604196 RepID=A0AAD4DIX3_9FUNG|nr:hypothetical protein BGZ95_001892 [Linnemannia exigua]
MAAAAWPCSRRPWSALLALGLINALVVLSSSTSHPQANVLFHSNNKNTYHALPHPFLITEPSCICLDQHNDHNTCPPQPQCYLDSVDTMQEIQATADTRSTDTTPTHTQFLENHEHRTIIENKPASSPTIPGSTVVVYPQESGTASTQTNNPEPAVTPPDTVAHEDPLTTGHTHPEEALVHSTSTVSPSPSGSHAVESVKPSFVASTTATPTGTPASKRTATTTTTPQPERHILSYEQWRKQVLEKKNKPAEVAERKQRKRKPYQENTVDVAIGGEEEIGFVFPNLDSGHNKGADERAQLVGDQLGNGPDLKLAAGRDKEWIKSEYAKDPKDRFNHASATCAASVVKASKDATSITAILNEGKDNYMLNKCSTKDKFFVVELCEEILVDTFILGNYEFFSSTFKDFVVSVNRYPPRDDGWSILGQFQARNTRDAQVFKPTAPQLATYIRFDFVNHYGNEYYCPVTLLRVYGATALEQLKQEEEEEKRLAEEEKRRAELEKAKQAVMEAEDDDDDDDGGEPEVIEKITDTTTETTKDHSTIPLDHAETIRSDTPSTDKPIETPQSSAEPTIPSGSQDIKVPQAVFDGDPSQPTQVKEGADPKDFEETHAEHHSNSENPNTAQPTFVLPEWPTEDFDEDLFKEDDPAHHGSGAPDTTPNSFGETTTVTAEQPPSDILLPLPSTTPASMQDDDDWTNRDLGMITLSPKNKPTPTLKPQSGSKAPSAGLGTPGGHSSATDSSAHPQPTLHSSQESVYKNIVNRLKALELNSSLSYQYLEEQSNVFNEVLESSEQKINQLVTHLNEAHRRLETLGRKYDQLAYSYRSHVEVDGEKRRQEFINLSSQVHLLGTQLVFQRQLFVVGAISLILVIAFIAITRSSSMQYAIHQSPLGVKLRAMSRHKGTHRSNDITSSVRIGSVEALSQFDQSTLRVPHLEDNRTRSGDEDCHMTPPISPMSPLTPDPGHAASGLMPHLHPGSGIESHHPDSSSVHSSEEVSRLIHSAANTTPFPNDYRPDSPVFQGPSSGQDDGQLSDADVAYMSRDMNVADVHVEDKTAISPKSAVRTLDDDVGFVSDSVLDSAPENIVSHRDQGQSAPVHGDWDKQHGVGEILPAEKDDDSDHDRDQEEMKFVSESSGSRRPSGSALSDVATAGETDPTKERPQLTRHSSSKSRRRSSHSIHRTQEHSMAARGKNHSASAAVGLGVGLGLGLEMASSSDTAASYRDLPPRPEPCTVQQQQQTRRQSSNDLDKGDDGTLADDDDAMVPGQSIGRGERRRRAKGPVTPTEDHTVPRRRVSYGRRESVEKDQKEEQARQGDDEQSPQSSRKTNS